MNYENISRIDAENKSILKDACFIIQILMKHLQYNITVPV